MAPSIYRRAWERWQQVSPAEFGIAAWNYGLKRLSYIDRIDRLCRDVSRRKLRERMVVEETTGDVVDTALDFTGCGHYSTISPLQIGEELQQLARELSERDPSRIMEIGTANGGTLYTGCRVADPLDQVVSLDPPGGDFGDGYTERQA